jgi:hypothetical protein
VTRSATTRLFIHVRTETVCVSIKLSIDDKQIGRLVFNSMLQVVRLLFGIAQLCSQGPLKLANDLLVGNCLS